MTLARATALMYLGLAVTGIAYFIGTRTVIYNPDNAASTLSNISSHKALAHLDLALQLAVVVFQALTAWCFYTLLRPLSPGAAWGVGVFGAINATLILIAAAAVAVALTVAGDASLAVGNDTASTVQLLYLLGEHVWGVSSVFFGLWLLPMGWVALSSGRMPKALGWILLTSGCGYVVSAFVGYGIADAPRWLVDGLTAPATIGELWIIGYLLVRGLDTEQVSA